MRTLPIALALLCLPASASAQLEANPRSIDLGDRGHNERPEAALTLTNRGTGPVLVREIRKCCDSISISPESLPAPIPPGGTATLKVSLGSGRVMGRLDKWITLATDSKAQPELRIPISMRVFEDYSLEPRDLRIEGVVGGKPQAFTVDVLRRRAGASGTVHLEVRKILGRFNRPSDRFLQADVSPVGQGQRITIRLDPGHPEGPISAELEASLDGKALFIPINGDMFAWIKVSPNYINFSRAVEGDLSSTTQAVILSSTDGTPFRILEVAVQAARERDGSARLEFSPVPLDSAAGQRPGSAAGPVSGSAATGFKIICKAFTGNGKDRTFFGTVTIRTDHPKKPLISLKYSGFFAEGPKR